MKILAVDDDLVFLEILSHALRENGYSNLRTINSPIDALQFLRTEKDVFDCILLDIEMPDLSGVELCEKIRNIPSFRQTPIIMITSLSDRSNIDRAFKAGASDYVTKPLEKSELKVRLGHISEVIREQQRIELLEYQLNLQKAVIPLEFEFHTPISVPDFERGIELYALQNYLMALGVKGLFSISAFAIGIENAHVAYRMATRLAFRNVLSDVGTVIEDCLKTKSLLICYSGSGRFIGVLMDQAEWNATDLELEMNAKMEDFLAIYKFENIELPKIRVGPAVKNSLFSLTPSAQVLDRAVAELTTQYSRQRRDLVRHSFSASG